jgi:hypothetical protein
MNQTNNDFFPWDDVPDSNVFPTMTGLFEWTKLEDGESSTGKRMARAVFQCVQPAEYAGMCHFENFVLGNDENMKGIVQGAMGTKALKQAAKAAQLRIDSMQAACDLVQAQKPQLMLSLAYAKEEKGEYAGREQNRVTAYHKVGERAVQIAPKPGSQVRMNAPKAMPSQAPAMPTQTAPPAAAAAPASPVQAPSAPAQAPPTTAPAPPAPAPAQQATVAASAPPEQAAPAVNEPTIPCTICGQMVPATQYNEHVQAHANEG